MMPAFLGVVVANRFAFSVRPSSFCAGADQEVAEVSRLAGGGRLL